MDGQEYLNQISAANRPAKAPSKMGNILGSIYFKIGIGAVAALIVIMIIGAALGGGGSAQDKLVAVKLRMDRTMEVIQDYQSSVKSSNLRSSSASLYGVLSNTNTQLTSYLADKYSYTDKKADKNLTEEADLNAEELSGDLFEAKITGTLDRTYAHKMAYEISWFANQEVSLINSSKDENLKSILNTSYQSLDNLYDNFNDFSETK